MSKFIKILCVALLISILSTTSFAQLSPPQVIALIPPDINLENENLIESLCPKSLPNQKSCRDEKLRPRTWRLSVYERANANSRLLGSVLVEGTPGKGLKAQFVANGQSPINLPPDSKGTDWGYSSYFEFTVADVIGDWIQLPKRPFPAPVWINIKREWQKLGEPGLIPNPNPLGTETVYAVPSLGNIIITKFSEKDFRYRPENANDMLCGEEPKSIPPSQLKETVKPISILFDKDGHLVAWPAYSRGC